MSAQITHGVSKRVARCLFWLLGSVLACAAVAEPRLIDIRYQSLQPGLSEFELVFDDVVAEPDSELGVTPPQLRLSFADASSALALAELPIEAHGIARLTQGNRNGQAEVVFHLDEPLAFAGQMDGQRYRLQLSSNGDQLDETLAESAVISRIRAIDFQRGRQGEGILQLLLDGPRSAFDISQRAEQVEMVFFNSAIDDELLYRLNVVDFATPVASVESFRDQQNVRLLIEPMADYRYEYQQVGDRVLVTFWPDMEGSGERSQDEAFDGEMISLNFQDIQVRTVLQILADYSGFNLVASDTVSGSVTLRLDQVPWDQALSIILKAKGLDKRVQGNVMLVAPADELAAQETKALENALQLEQLRPLYSEMLQINYAKARDIAELLKSKENNLLSERGNITVDERTNTLLIQDNQDKLADVRRLIEVLDVPVRQVVIEARMVTIKESLGDELGVRLGVTDSSVIDGNPVGFAGSLEGADIVANPPAGASNLPDLPDRLNVDLPAAGAAGVLGVVMKLDDSTLLDLELSALERENKGEVIASPKLTTANQKPAYIEQGVEIPFVQATSGGATSVSFKKAVLGLQVTPHITPDKRIILDLVINQDTRGDTVQTGTGPAVAIDTQEINTQVLAENGQTIVLGGIFQQNSGFAVSKVPLLGDLPLIGSLFRNTSRIDEKNEVLIFVTPRIVDQDLWQQLLPSGGWNRAADAS